MGDQLKKADTRKKNAETKLAKKQQDGLTNDDNCEHTLKRRRKTREATSPDLVEENFSDEIADNILAQADAVMKVEYNELCEEVANTSRKRRNKGSRNGDESEHTLKSKKKTKNAAAAEFAKKEKTLMEEIADRAAQMGCLLEECPKEPLQFAVGDKVRNKYNLGGIITSVDMVKRTYTILYKDGRSDENLDESFVKPPAKKGNHYYTSKEKKNAPRYDVITEFVPSVDEWKSQLGVTSINVLPEGTKRRSKKVTGDDANRSSLERAPFSRKRMQKAEPSATTTDDADVVATPSVSAAADDADVVDAPSVAANDADADVVATPYYASVSANDANVVDVPSVSATTSVSDVMPRNDANRSSHLYRGLAPLSRHNKMQKADLTPSATSDDKDVVAAPSIAAETEAGECL